MKAQNTQSITNCICLLGRLTISPRFIVFSLLCLTASSCVQAAIAQTTELPSQVIQREKGMIEADPDDLRREGYNLINQGSRERGLIVLERAAELYLDQGKRISGIELLREIEKLYNKFGQTSDAQRVNRWISRQSKY